MTLRRTMVAIVILIAGAEPAGAATVATTPPFPGTDLLSGGVRCLAVNVDKKPKELTKMELIGTGGAVLRTIGPIIVNPDQYIVTVPAAFLEFDSPLFCRFVFEGKFRGSFAYYNGAAAEVLPAISR